VGIVVDRIDSGPPYHSNCYLVREGAAAVKTVAIDPGGSARDVLGWLERAGTRLAGILVTHADIDHVAAVAELCTQTAAQVWAPVGEADALSRGVTRGGLRVSAHAPEHLVRDGDTVELAGLNFDVVDVRGHSADHIAFATSGALFAGDLLFAGSVGRSDLPGGDELALIASIRRLFDRFDPDTIVYPGHGEPTTLRAERASNPFLASLRER
jgi:hydroxyacylglutathione hydrolase